MTTACFARSALRGAFAWLARGEARAARARVAAKTRARRRADEDRACRRAARRALRPAEGTCGSRCADEPRVARDPDAERARARAERLDAGRQHQSLALPALRPARHERALAEQERLSVGAPRREVERATALLGERLAAERGGREPGRAACELRGVEVARDDRVERARRAVARAPRDRARLAVRERAVERPEGRAGRRREHAVVGRDEERDRRRDHPPRPARAAGAERAARHARVEPDLVETAFGRREERAVRCEGEVVHRPRAERAPHPAVGLAEPDAARVADREPPAGLVERERRGALRALEPTERGEAQLRGAWVRAGGAREGESAEAGPRGGRVRACEGRESNRRASWARFERGAESGATTPRWTPRSRNRAKPRGRPVTAPLPTRVLLDWPGALRKNRPDAPPPPCAVGLCRRRRARPRARSRGDAGPAADLSLGRRERRRPLHDRRGPHPAEPQAALRAPDPAARARAARRGRARGPARAVPGADHARCVGLGGAQRDAARAQRDTARGRGPAGARGGGEPSRGGEHGRRRGASRADRAPHRRALRGDRGRRGRAQRLDR